MLGQVLVVTVVGDQFTLAVVSRMSKQLALRPYYAELALTLSLALLTNLQTRIHYDHYTGPSISKVRSWSLHKKRLSVSPYLIAMLADGALLSGDGFDPSPGQACGLFHRPDRFRPSHIGHCTSVCQKVNAKVQ